MAFLIGVIARVGPRDRSRLKPSHCHPAARNRLEGINTANNLILSQKVIRFSLKFWLMAGS